jgi:tRNA-dihydrouridine synthase B
MSPQPLRVGPLVIDPPLLLAPMAAVTNPPMRTLCEEMGCGLTLTEFLPAHAVAHGVEKVVRNMTAGARGRPFGVQIFGRLAADMAGAGRAAVAMGASLVDINMGCPAKRVVAGECGSALMRTPDLAADLVAAVRAAVPADVPVTAKVRAGWDDKHRNAPEFAARLVEAGAAMITVHGRTRAQAFSGRADLHIIREVKEAVGVPVIGNGDVVDAESMLGMLDATGCDGVMIGRGAMGNPWIFSRLAAVLAGRPNPGPPSIVERHETLRRHYALYLDWTDEHHAVQEMRKHLGWYTRGLPHSADFRARVQTLCGAAHVLGEVDAYFARVESIAARAAA